MNIRYIYLLGISGLLLSSCSTQQLAQNGNADNVYYSDAKAVDKPAPVRYAAQPAQDVQDGSINYDDGYYYDDDTYANRLDRFYSYSPWRSYYDPFWGGGGYDNWYGNGYAFSPYAGYYNPTFSYGLGFGLGLGFGSPWGYGNPYSYWGPNSFYNYYGAGYAAWGGGYYGLNGFPGYYGGGVVANNPNYRARPVRSGDGAGYINTGRPIGGRTGYVTDSRGNVRPITGTNGLRVPRSRPGSVDGNIDRSTARPVERTRPTRTEMAPPRQEMPTRVERSYPSSPSPSSGGGGGGRSGGGGGGGGRPTRTGG